MRAFCGFQKGGPPIFVAPTPRKTNMTMAEQTLFEGVSPIKMVIFQPAMLVFWRVIEFKEIRNPLLSPHFLNPQTATFQVIKPGTVDGRNPAITTWDV